MSNGADTTSVPNGNGNGWVRILSLVGLPGALAIYLVWWTTYVVGLKMEKMVELLTTIATTCQVGART